MYHLQTTVLLCDRIFQICQNSVNTNGGDPFFDVFYEHCQSGADPWLLSRPTRQNCLHAACKQGFSHKKLIGYLCSHQKASAQINVTDNIGSTALHYIVQTTTQSAVVQYILHIKGVDITVKNRKCHCPLQVTSV